MFFESLKNYLWPNRKATQNLEKPEMITVLKLLFKAIVGVTI